MAKSNAEEVDVSKKKKTDGKNNIEIVHMFRLDLLKNGTWIELSTEKMWG